MCFDSKLESERILQVLLPKNAEKCQKMVLSRLADYSKIFSFDCTNDKNKLGFVTRTGWRGKVFQSFPWYAPSSNVVLAISLFRAIFIYRLCPVWWFTPALITWKTVPSGCLLVTFIISQWFPWLCCCKKKFFSWVFWGKKPKNKAFW